MREPDGNFQLFLGGNCDTNCRQSKAIAARPGSHPVREWENSPWSIGRTHSQSSLLEFFLGHTVRRPPEPPQTRSGAAGPLAGTTPHCWFGLFWGKQRTNAADNHKREKLRSVTRITLACLRFQNGTARPGTKTKRASPCGLALLRKPQFYLCAEVATSFFRTFTSTRALLECFSPLPTAALPMLIT